MTQHGSKVFRVHLRKRDEFLIRMENITIESNVLLGKSLDQEIRTLAQVDNGKTSIVRGHWFKCDFFFFRV